MDLWEGHVGFWFLSLSSVLSSTVLQLLSFCLFVPDFEYGCQGMVRIKLSWGFAGTPDPRYTSMWVCLDQ